MRTSPIQFLLQKASAPEKSARRLEDVAVNPGILAFHTIVRRAADERVPDPPLAEALKLDPPRVPRIARKGRIDSFLPIAILENPTSG